MDGNEEGMMRRKDVAAGDITWDVMGMVWKDNWKKEKRALVETCYTEDEAKERLDELMSSGMAVHIELWRVKHEKDVDRRKRMAVVSYNRHGDMTGFEREG